MTEEEKKEFEEFLKWKAEKAKETEPSVKGSEPIKVDVNANVNAKIAPSVNMGWSQKLSCKQKNWLGVYSVWSVIHLLLLVCGEGKDKFFPHIYQGYNYTEEYYERMRKFGFAPSPEEEWKIKWDLDYYGLPEFIVYVVLVPLVIYFIYILFKNKKKATPSNSNNHQ